MGMSYIRRKQWEAQLIATEVILALDKSMSKDKKGKGRFSSEAYERRGQPRQWKGSVVSLLNEMSRPLR